MIDTRGEAKALLIAEDVLIEAKSLDIEMTEEEADELLSKHGQHIGAIMSEEGIEWINYFLQHPEEFE